MPRAKPCPVYRRPAAKNTYHTFGLQSLPPKQFANVVRRILRGQNQLVTCRDSRTEVSHITG
jgi:hypothetical protein